MRRRAVYACGMECADYKVRLQRDAETNQVVADIPALGISDYAPDEASALDSLREMAAFHLECLFEEGAPAPVETDESEGVFIRVRRPSRAA